MAGFTLFTTALGTAAIAWRDEVVTAVTLPSPNAQATRAAMRRRLGEATEMPPPAVIRAVIDRIRGLLSGTADDMSDVAVDLSGLAPFQRRVYELVRTIKAGSSLTYGQVAEGLGEPDAAQAVGQAMGHNPVPIIVPCHRVVAAGGKLGGFSAPGGAETKRRMLVIEGADLPDTQPVLFD